MVKPEWSIGTYKQALVRGCMDFIANPNSQYSKRYRIVFSALMKLPLTDLTALEGMLRSSNFSQKNHTCPTCDSHEVDPCGRGGFRCAVCGTIYGAD